MTKASRPKTTSYKDTAFGIIPRNKVVALEKEGVKKGLQYILLISKKKTPITPDIICKVHKVCFGFIFPKWAGKFRTTEVTVGWYIPPHASRVHELIKNLCDDLTERFVYLPSPQAQEKFLTDIISLLAWFQHRFVWIHPFNDYNGRTARLLTNLILLNKGLPVLEIKADTDLDRKQYLQAVEKADKYDLTKLEKLIANALKESLEKID